MAQDEPAIGQKDRNEFLWHVHSYVNEHIRFADTKAQLVIGWATAVAGALVASGFYDRMEFRSEKMGRLAALLLLVLSVACGVVAINPRLSTKQPKGYIFWSSILGHGSRGAFLEATEGIGASEAGEHIANHLFDLSLVCQNKF